MHYLNLPVACLTLTIATFTTFGMMIPRAEASASQSLQLQAQRTNWLIQGIQKTNQEDYQGALSDFTQAIEINPQNAEAYYQRGLIYVKYAQGKPLNPDGTVPGCKRIDDYRIICPVTVKDRIKENKRKAIDDFTQATQLNPQYAAAYYQRGLVEDEQQKKIEDFQKAKKLYLQKSFVYLKQNDYKQAADLLEIIDKIYGQTISLTKLSVVEKKQTDENPINSSTVSSEQKKLPEVLMGEARLALGKGDKQKAIQTYREVARILEERKDPRYQELQQIIAELEQNANK
ncbi:MULTISPECIES: tetratricopeptide repeat protein [Nostoc]|uniref:Tetratricopeptide repeat protein n=1 Tax=Nostoc paludosum FACHB-159 TaxID=2692908 RepID=A0ABR8KCY8_9NOSO|nr:MULTISPECIES: tetratricopeptide repeat protein [Nostoc]MBD2680928.1 tetratricopeptide repeat protein [Nostoc sp. FACHB-857]MBD2737404.1 tetratricopeptide repeat protein [Nostoc paludosum FACHB-159]